MVTVDGVAMVTTAEAARIGGVGSARVRQLLKAGAFPRAVKLGRDWLLPVEDVRKWAAWGWLARRRRPRPREEPEPVQLQLPGDTSSLQGP